MWIRYFNIHNTLALEEPKQISIPVVAIDKVDGSTTTKDFPVLLPHKILKYLFETAQIEIHEDNLRKFWSHLREVQHPWVQSIDTTNQFIPIGVHGDEAHYGADTANINKLTCIFLDLPLWRPKNARLSRFLMFCIDSSQCVGYETLHPVLQSIAESINWAYFGMDETGQITTHRKFILSELRGDQVWHHYIWRHLNWWRKRECCFSVWCSPTEVNTKRSFVLWHQRWCGMENHYCRNGGFYCQWCGSTLTLPICNLHEIQRGYYKKLFDALCQFRTGIHNKWCMFEVTLGSWLLRRSIYRVEV